MKSSQHDVQFVTAGASLTVLLTKIASLLTLGLAQVNYYEIIRTRTGQSTWGHTHAHE